MKKNEPAIIKEVKTVTRFRGLGLTARALGISAGHLSYVLHGQRKPSQRLVDALQDMGVELPEL